MSAKGAPDSPLFMSDCTMQSRYVSFTTSGLLYEQETVLDRPRGRSSLSYWLRTDGFQSVPATMASSAAVTPRDLGNVRDLWLFSVYPCAVAQDVLLQQAKQRFHACKIAAGPGATHRSDCLAGPGGAKLPGTELRTANRGQSTAKCPSTLTHGDGVLERLSSQT